MIQTELELNKLLTEHGYDTSAECVQRAITHYVSGKWLLLHGGAITECALKKVAKSPQLIIWRNGKMAGN